MLINFRFMKNIKIVFYLPAIIFWSNFFVKWSHFFGVNKTIYLIQRVAGLLPLKDGTLEHVSKRFDYIYKHMRFLFAARRQKCLLRGFLLYFYGKRMKTDVRLVFGVQKVNDKGFNWHCWLIEGSETFFEPIEPLQEFERVLEYK